MTFNSCNDKSNEVIVHFKVLKEYGVQTEFLRAEDVANAVLYAINQPFNCAINSILLEPIGAPI